MVLNRKENTPAKHTSQVVFIPVLSEETDASVHLLLDEISSLEAASVGFF